MARLHTPRQVLQEAYLAASADKEAPDGGMQMLQQVTERIRLRGLLDIAMSRQSIEDLMDEEVEKHFAEQAAELAHAETIEFH